jgi:hypothetical protein
MKSWLIIFALFLTVTIHDDGIPLSSSFQRESFINVSRIPGVDCTGTGDSSAALNHLFDARQGGNIDGKHVIIPSLCKLRVDHQVIVFGQSNFVMDGE